MLQRVAGQAFRDTSALSLRRLRGDQENIGENPRSVIQSLTPAACAILESFAFHLQRDRLEKAAGLLCMVCERFAPIVLHPQTAVSNAEMGLVCEELIRKFAELCNETAWRMQRHP